MSKKNIEIDQLLSLKPDEVVSWVMSLDEKGKSQSLIALVSYSQQQNQLLQKYNEAIKKGLEYFDNKG